MHKKKPRKAALFVQSADFRHLELKRRRVNSPPAFRFYVNQSLAGKDVSAPGALREEDTRGRQIPSDPAVKKILQSGGKMLILEEIGGTCLRELSVGGTLPGAVI